MSRPPAFLTKTGGLSLHLLLRGNRGQISQIVIFGAVGDGFQIFRISPVGDAHARDLSLLCHGNGFGFGNEGFVGKLVSRDPAALLHKPDDALCVSTGLLFKPRQSVDKEYLYYALQQYEFAQYIISHVDSESAQPNISAGTIGKYQIVLPPIDTQKRIGALLRAYDKKRENNRKINDNLAA